MKKPTLTSESQYSEIRKWFSTNYKKLPQTLDRPDIDERNLHGKVHLLIKLVDKEFEIHVKKKIKISQKAIDAKNELYNIYIDLQDRAKWNLPLKKMEENDQSLKKKKKK